MTKNILLPPVFVSMFFLSPARSESPMDEADRLDRAGRPREALAVLDRLPATDEVLWRVARQHDRLAARAQNPTARRSHLAAAREASLRAVQANPGNANAHLALAIVYGRLAEREKPARQMELARLIREHAQRAVDIDPGHDMAWHVLARWHHGMASVHPAVRSLAGAVFGKLPPASHREAEACFLRAIAAGPPRVTHHVEYGLMLVELGRKNDARKQLGIGLSLPAKDPDDEDTQQRAREALANLR